MAQAAASFSLVIGTALVSAGLIVLLRPLLLRYALARPNARSSHTTPTPQGAGIAVVISALIGMAAAVWWGGGDRPVSQLMPFVPVIVVLAMIGFVDDIAPLPPVVRLVVQAMAAVGLMMALPEGARALPLLPYWLEFAVEVAGLVWFINLTNFMDGIDGMTVAGIVPPLAGIALLVAPSLVEFAVALALALIGALAGFAPFNRHVAKVFLGDVGSLAIGGIAGWLLLVLACDGHLVSALILAAYYLADTGVTLFRRWRRGANLSQAHREHCYQLALSRGFSVPQVILRVWILNLALIGPAAVAAATPQVWIQAVCLMLAGLLVAAMLRHLGGDGVPRSGVAVGG